MDVITFNHHELPKLSSDAPEDDLDQDYDQEEELQVNNNSRHLVPDPEPSDTTSAPPLRKSLFPHVPPYIIFQSYDSTSHNLPLSVTKHLKWKLSTITPLVVRRTVVNSGFRLVKKSPDWIGTWGKYMKSNAFKLLKDTQKVNHFPGTFHIGRKDRLWRNLSRLMSKHGRSQFGFAPRTYVLPQDLRSFRQVWEKTGGKEKWIVKPPASARGTGIKVVHRWSQIPKKRPIIVQQYLSKPLLIGGAKFDLRLYVLVTSFNPLRVYLYPDGLVRFASVKYNDDINYLSDRLMHLTNYSINKTSASYTSNECADSCAGHKWTIKTFMTYMEKEGVNTQKLWNSIRDIVVKTMIAGEPPINTLTRANTTTRYSCFELFGVDILLDENIKPWLLEVNISPSLQSSSALDVAVKGPLVKNLFNMVGYQLPASLPRKEITALAKAYEYDLVCQDVRLDKMTLSSQEKQKQALYVNLDREDYVEDILDDLTPDDVRHLIAHEDEICQAGEFERVFPIKNSAWYLDFFDVPRYYNLLLDAWEDKYGDNREKGIDLLRKMCEEKIHLENTA